MLCITDHWVTENLISDYNRICGDLEAFDVEDTGKYAILGMTIRLR